LPDKSKNGTAGTIIGTEAWKEGGCICDDGQFKNSQLKSKKIRKRSGGRRKKGQKDGRRPQRLDKKIEAG